MIISFISCSKSGIDQYNLEKHSELVMHMFIIKILDMFLTYSKKYLNFNGFIIRKIFLFEECASARTR